ncbi:MAG: CHAT domain-containing protein [Bacteroidales bacterium]|nr:CHAT domain-containing protein [Bacteroidales bacterium]MCF8454777.1 CHAT domain-containing protein [Bacteroidales bacterium]
MKSITAIDIFKTIVLTGSIILFNSYFVPGQKLADTLMADEYCLNAESFSVGANYDSALLYYQYAADIYIKTQIWEKYIKSMNGVCVQIRELKNYPRALELADSTYQIAKEKLPPNHVQIGNCFNIYKTIYALMGDMVQLEIYSQKEIDILKENYGENHPKVAEAYRQTGLSYYLKDDYVKSMDYYNTAMQIMLKSEELDSMLLGRIYVSLGSGYLSLKEFAKSNLYYKKALALFTLIDYDNYTLIAHIHLAMGNNYSAMQKQNLSLIFYKQAYDIAEKYLKDNVWGATKIYGLMAMAYIHFYDERGIRDLNGIDVVKVGNELYGRTLRLYESVLPHDHNYIGAACLNYGLTFYYLESLDSAELYLNRAVEICRLDEITNSEYLAVAYNDLAAIYYSRGNQKLAKKCYQKSVDYHLIHDGKYSQGTAFAYHQLSSSYMQELNYESALFCAQKALQSSIKDFMDDDPYKNPNVDSCHTIQFLCPVLEAKGNALTEKYKHQSNNIKDLEAALEAYHLSGKVINDMIDHQSAESGKLFHTQQAYAVHSKCIDLCSKLYKLTNNPTYINTAFSYSEQNRAQVVKESLRNSLYSNNHADIEDEGSKEREQKANIASIENQLIEEFNQNGIKNLNRVVSLENELIDEYVRYDSIRNRNREYEKPESISATLERQVSAKSVSPVDVFAYLKTDNAALIEYFLSDTVLHIFAFAGGEFQFQSVSIDTSFKGLANQFIKCTGNAEYIYEHPKQAFDIYKKSAHKLYTVLFPPEISMLIKNTPKLHIVADGILHYLSFDALLVDAPDDSENYQSLNYLIHGKSISYSYSAAMLLLNKTKLHAQELYAGYAPVYDTEGLANSQDLMVFRSFRSAPVPLKGNTMEIESTAGFFNGDSFTGEYANEKVFKETASKYNILHLAMHALLDVEDPLESKLIFAQNKDMVEDNFLNCHEIYGLNLNANLAVLSACQTAAGQIEKGEGVMSLTRAFMYAGVPSIVSTLWLADDASTKDIMLGFFDGLASKLPKDEALRQSKLKYLKNADPVFAHPFYWANFILVGDNHPISMTGKNRNGNVLLISILGFAFLLTAIIVIRKRRSLGRGY